MNISEVANLTQLSPKSIRLYEDKGVISPPLRSENGYRTYGAKQIKELGIVAKARSAGFSLDECRALVELADNPCRESADVKAKAQSKLNEVNRKIRRSIGNSKDFSRVGLNNVPVTQIAIVQLSTRL